MVDKIGIVNEVYITLYGDVLSKEIQEIPPKSIREKTFIPVEIKFNSSWMIEHKCLRCSNTIVFDHDYANGKFSYVLVKNLDTEHFRIGILRVFTKLIENIEVREIDNVHYLNRLDFNYEYDIQRMSSVAPATYSCMNCLAEYIAILRIGLPVNPDRGLPSGEIGRIYIGRITLVKVEGGKRFIDLLEEYKVKK